MQLNFAPKFVNAFVFGCSLILFTGSAIGQVKNVLPVSGSLNTPIGMAFDQYTNQLLLTLPFCGTPTNNNMVTGFQIASIDGLGNTYKFATLPDVPVSSQHPGVPYGYCFENYIAVSPGLGGFTPGAVFVTQGQNIIQVPPGGGTGTLFATLPGTADTESGIAFDTVGTFCYNMIVTEQDGKVFLIDSTGHSTLYTTVPQVPNPMFSVEGATVAPATFGHYAGWMIVPLENPSQVVAVAPPNSCPVTLSAPPATDIVVNNLPGPPETVKVVPPNACNFGPIAFGGGAGGTFFTLTNNPAIQFPPATNQPQIVAYPASNFSGLTGNLMLPIEEVTTRVDILTPTALSPFVTDSIFDSNVAPPKWEQLEDATFATCPTAVGCVLTAGGYKNRFISKVTGLVIGGTYYTAAQVTQMVALSGGGISALARSLATAKLNVLYGALAPAAVQLAIIQADALIASVTTNAVPPVTVFQATLPSALTDPLNATLDKFNNGLAPGGPTQECTK
jgi:hypothetical protein